MSHQADFPNGPNVHPNSSVRVVLASLGSQTSRAHLCLPPLRFTSRPHSPIDTLPTTYQPISHPSDLQDSQLAYSSAQQPGDGNMVDPAQPQAQQGQPPAQPGQRGSYPPPTTQDEGQVCKEQQRGSQQYGMSRLSHACRTPDDSVGARGGPKVELELEVEAP